MHTNDGRQNVRASAISSGKVTNLEPAKREAIRTVFLHRADSYGLPEVARLTGIPSDRLRREVAADRRDASKVRGRWRFTWRQLAYLAMAGWTLAEIHEALGDDAAVILPPLLTLRAVTVQLPEYVLRALETIATDDGATLDDCLYGELLDFAGSVCTRVGNRIDGYRSAYFFPGQG
jgi:hypothetical protein